jgi:hypothetical protein
MDKDTRYKIKNNIIYYCPRKDRLKSYIKMYQIKDIQCHTLHFFCCKNISCIYKIIDPNMKHFHGVTIIFNFIFVPE